MSVQLNSNDGMQFIVPNENCLIAHHIRDTLNMSDPDEELPTLDFPMINGPTLGTIVEFMNTYAKTPFAPIDKKEGNFDHLPEYYINLINNTKFVSNNLEDIHGSDISLMSLMIAADHLNMDCLTSLIAAKLASAVRGKPLKQLYPLFGLPEDHVAKVEDVEKIREDYAYILSNENKDKN